MPGTIAENAPLYKWNVYGTIEIHFRSVKRVIALSDKTLRKENVTLLCMYMHKIFSRVRIEVTTHQTDTILIFAALLHARYDKMTILNITKYAAQNR